MGFGTETLGPPTAGGFNHILSDDLDADNNRIKDLGKPLLESDAATKKYVDDQFGDLLSKSGGTLTGALTLSGPPTSNLHASTKKYVDDEFAKALPIDGSKMMQGRLDLNGNPLSGLRPPVSETDAATKKYVDGAHGTLLPKSGGTLTGPLTLSGAPTSSLQAATKDYVDLRVERNGDTMSGPLSFVTPTQNAHASKKYVDDKIDTTLPLDGTRAMTGELNMNNKKISTLADPIQANHAANKRYVDSEAAKLLPKSGGSMTGTLTLNADPTTNFQASTKKYVDEMFDDAFPINGSRAMRGPLRLGGNFLSGLRNPKTDFEVATKKFVDDEAAKLLPLSGGTMTGQIILSGEPTSNLHAATKKYVDETIVTPTLADFAFFSSGLDKQQSGRYTYYQFRMIGSTSLSEASSSSSDISNSFFEGHSRTSGGRKNVLELKNSGQYQIFFIDTFQTQSGQTNRLVLEVSRDGGANFSDEKVVNITHKSADQQAEFNVFLSTTSSVRLSIFADHALRRGYGNIWIRYSGSSTDSTPFLSRSGGTMTGALTLSGPPTQYLHPATKGFVESNIAIGDFIRSRKVDKRRTVSNFSSFDSTLTRNGLSLHSFPSSSDLASISIQPSGTSVFDFVKSTGDNPDFLIVKKKMKLFIQGEILISRSAAPLDSGSTCSFIIRKYSSANVKLANIFQSHHSKPTTNFIQTFSAFIDVEANERLVFFSQGGVLARSNSSFLNIEETRVSSLRQLMDESFDRTLIIFFKPGSITKEAANARYFHFPQEGGLVEAFFGQNSLNGYQRNVFERRGSTETDRRFLKLIVSGIWKIKITDSFFITAQKNVFLNIFQKSPFQLRERKSVKIYKQGDELKKVFFIFKNEPNDSIQLEIEDGNWTLGDFGQLVLTKIG